MSDDIDASARYRQRAEELRTIASDKAALDVRNQLLALAEDYERLAFTHDAMDAMSMAMERAATSASSDSRH